MSNLDPASRRTLRWLAFKLALIAGVGAAGAAVAVDPAASLLAVAFALASGEEPRRDALGLWDGALVLGALALLAHAAGVLLRP